MRWNKNVLDEVKLYQANDYEIKDETTEYILLEKKTSSLLGHIVIFFFFWWTLGLANLVYYWLARKNRKVMK
jgi:hypothetical protein